MSFGRRRPSRLARAALGRTAPGLQPELLGRPAGDAVPEAITFGDDGRMHVATDGEGILYDLELRR